MAIAKAPANYPNDYFKPEVWSALTLENWYAEGLIPKIANTNWEGEIKKAGQLVHIRRDPKAILSPYVNDTPIQYQDVVDEKTTLTIDYAYSAAHKVSSIDLAQMDIDVVSKLAAAINKEHMMKENEIVFSVLPTLTMNANNVIDKSAAQQTTTVGANYILNGLVALRTAFNRRRVPKSGRYVVVSPEVEDVLLRMDHTRYDVTGMQNKVIQEGDFNLRIAGFDILVSEFVTGAGTGGSPYLCPAGVKDAFTFARQLTEVEVGFTLQDSYGKGIKALNVFGFNITQPDGMGLWKVQV